MATFASEGILAGDLNERETLHWLYSPELRPVVMICAEIERRESDIAYLFHAGRLSLTQSEIEVRIAQRIMSFKNYRCCALPCSH